MSRSTNTLPQVLLPEEFLAKPLFNGRIPVLSRTTVRVSTMICSEQTIKSVSKCRFTNKARRTTGITAVEPLSNQQQRTFDSENAGLIQSRLHWRTKVTKKSQRQEDDETLETVVSDY
jgi:hypothetical protein